MKKILIIVILLLLVYFGVNYALNIFLPGKISQTIKNLAQEKLDRKLTINRVDVNIVKGIFLREITLFETDGKTPYLEIKTIHLAPSYASLISSKKLFLSVQINGVFFTLEKKADKTFNLPKIKREITEQTRGLAEKETSLPGKESTLIFIKSLSVADINIDFVDESINYRKKFSGIKVNSDLSHLPEIISKVNWQNNLSGNAIYNLETAELKSSLTLKEISMEEFAPYIKQIKIKGGLLKNGRVDIEGKENYSIDADIAIADLIAEGEQTKLKADIHAKAKIFLSTDNFTYKASGNISNGALKALPYINSLTSINTDFFIDNQKMQLSGIQAIINAKDGKEKTLGVPIKANAEINFTDSEIYLETQIDSPITRVIEVIKNIHSDDLAMIKALPLEESGNIDLKAKTKIDLKNKLSEYYINYSIKEAAFGELKDIWAIGFLKNDKLTIEKCSFKNKNAQWQGTMDLENFSAPAIKGNFYSPFLSVNFETKQVKEIIRIPVLTLKTKNSQLTAEGNFVRDKNYLELTGLAYIDLADIGFLLKLYDTRGNSMAKANPQGVLNIKFMLTGPLEPDKWEVKLAGLAETLNIYNIKGDNVKLELYKDATSLIVSPIVASVAGGKLELRAKIDKINNKITINTLINDIDLAILKEQLKLNTGDLGGILSFEADIVNKSLTSWDKLEGSGKVNIHDGNIWEINFLKGIGEFLFIPEFEAIKFEEGYSDLTFKGDNVVFDNIELNSYQMDLKGKGIVSLRGDLNFMLVSKFNPNLVSASQGLQKFFTGVLGQNGLAIDVKGNFKNPTYKVKPVFLSDLGGFKKALDDVLQ